MRISDYEREVIVNSVTSVDPCAKIWLFGSRVDDSKKGGDIDLGILSSRIGVMKEIEIKQKIWDKIGEQKIDLVVSKDGQEAFFKYAVTKGIFLYG